MTVPTSASLPGAFVEHRADTVRDALAVASAHLRTDGFVVVPRTRSNGVPFLLVTRGPCQCAVAWFFNPRIFRVYYPWLSSNPPFRHSCPEVYSLVDTVRLILDPDSLHP